MATTLDLTVPTIRTRAAGGRAALPPGPRAPALVQTLLGATKTYDYVERCARRFGDCFTVRIVGGPPMVLFSHPDAVRDIFTGDPEEMHGGESAAPLGPILGWQSILLQDGARHERLRRLMLPPFHGERLQAHAGLMRQITDEEIEGWPLDRPFPIQKAMQRITLEVILRVVFGVAEGERLERLRTRLLRLLALAESPTAAFIALPLLNADLGRFSPWGRFVHRLREVDELLFEEIRRRRGEGTAGRCDVLSMLIDARDENGDALSAQELRDQMFTLLMAGHETTASSLAWVFYHVLVRPPVVQALRSELEHIAGAGPLETEHLGRLEYLDATIKESARFTPVVGETGRLLATQAQIGGRDLPAGVIAAASIVLAHRRPDVWHDPDRFEPERFIGLRPNPYSFFPFGGGVRRCIGAAFATLEMKTILARVLARVEMRLADGYHARIVRRAVTLAPSRGVPVIACARVPVHA